MASLFPFETGKLKVPSPAFFLLDWRQEEEAKTTVSECFPPGLLSRTAPEPLPPDPLYLLGLSHTCGA